MSWGDNAIKNWRNVPQINSKSRSPQYQCTYQVWWKPIEIYSLLSWNENTDVLRADNSVKNWRNLLISNPEPDLRNIIAQTKFGQNPLIFTQNIIRKRKYWRRGQITKWKFNKICPLAIPNQIYIISMHISFMKIHWHLLKLSPGNENSDVLRAGNAVKNWRN